MKKVEVFVKLINSLLHSESKIMIFMYFLSLEIISFCNSPVKLFSGSVLMYDMILILGR